MTTSIPNVRWLLDAPRRYEPDMSKAGVVQFRHPWVVERLPPDGRIGPGIVIRRSFAKLDHQQRARVFMSAQALLAAMPCKRKGAPSGTDPRLLDAYFRPIEELEEAAMGGAISGRVSPPNAPFHIDLGGVMVSDDILRNPARLFKLGQRLRVLEEANAAHVRGGFALQRENEELRRLLAQKDRLLHKHVKVTLAEALAAFKSEYTPGDPQTKRNAERTLDRFVHGGELSDGRKVRGLGGGKLLAEVAPQDVDRWLDDYPNNNKASTIHRRAHLSIFFSTCQRVFDMAFTPFTSGKLKTRGDLLTIYKKRAPPAIKRVDDLKMLLDALDDDLYWQSWVAFACLAGPRWSEQQVLLAAAVDLDAVPPRVIFQATEAGDMKTVGNAVLIERNLLLPILRRFATTWEPRRLLAWPSLRENRKRGGEPVPDGAWRYNTFSRVLKAVLAKARQRSRDPNHDLWRFGPAEWRHTFGTLLALSGMNHSEVANWMRNSSQVAAACYVNFNPPDERVKDQLRWQ